MSRVIPRERLRSETNNKTLIAELFWEHQPKDSKAKAVFTAKPYHRTPDGKACYHTETIRKKGGWYSLQLLFEEYADYTGVLLANDYLLGLDHFEKLRGKKVAGDKIDIDKWQDHLKLLLSAEATQRIKEECEAYDPEDYENSAKFNMQANKFMANAEYIEKKAGRPSNAAKQGRLSENDEFTDKLSAHLDRMEGKDLN